MAPYCHNKTGPDLLVWFVEVDVLCINQDDPVERSQQVHLMNRIYRDAAHVLVWLGLDTKKEAVSALGLVHELEEAPRNYPVDGVSRDQYTVELETHVRENQKALQALTDRAWVSFPKAITTSAT